MDAQRQIVPLFIGQCGNQIARKVLKQICIDNAIAPDFRSVGKTESLTYGLQFLYRSSISDEFRSRSIHIDSEPSVIDDMLRSDLKHFILPKTHVVCHNEDASGCFGRGLLLGKSEFHERVRDCIRREAEYCDILQGFFKFYSIGGGTGSGYIPTLNSWIYDEFRSPNTLNFMHKPSDSNSITVEPLNACLAVSSMCQNEFDDVNFTFDNQSLYNILNDSLKMPKPNFADSNELIACLFSNTAQFTQRNFHSLRNNCIPFKKISYLSAAIVPFQSMHSRRAPQDVWNLLVDAFATNHEISNVNLEEGTYICVNLWTRGSATQITTMQALNNIEKHAKFTGWCNHGFNVFYSKSNYQSIPDGLLDNVETSVTKISTHTAMGRVFEKLQEQMNVLLSKRAFSHWYLDTGMEEQDFLQANESISDMISIYDLMISDDGNGE